MNCLDTGFQREKASFYIFLSLYFSSTADAFVHFGLVQWRTPWLTFFPYYGLEPPTSAYAAASLRNHSSYFYYYRKSYVPRHAEHSGSESCSSRREKATEETPEQIEPKSAQWVL
jgi:hypothetical protein